MASSTAQIHALGATAHFSSTNPTKSNPAKTVFFGTKLNNSVSSGLKLKSKCRSNNSRRNGPLRVVAEKVVGIDLGTTNSGVAAMEGGKPNIVTNAEGQRTTPSVVAYTKTGDRLVGQIAKRQAVVNPENTLFSVKRFIGRKMSEVDDESKQVSYTVARDDNGNVKLDCPAIGKQFAAEEISAQKSANRGEQAEKWNAGGAAENPSLNRGEEKRQRNGGNRAGVSVSVPWEEQIPPNALRRKRDPSWRCGFSLGVDLGLARTGLALSKGFSVRPLTVVELRGQKLELRLLDIAEKQEVDEFIIGLPKSSDGKETEQSNKVRSVAGRFAARAAERGWRVYLQDEHGTSSEALDHMIAKGLSKSAREGSIDAYAAVKVLERYFSHSGQGIELVVPKQLELQNKLLKGPPRDTDFYSDSDS